MKARALLLALVRILLFVVLLALPVLVRVGYYYRRPYEGRMVPVPDLANVQVVEQDIAPLAALVPAPVEGRVVIDRAHGNIVRDDELNVLLARLTAHGVQAVSLLPGEDLAAALRTARALIVISPHLAYSASETQAVEQFIAQGGRALLAADPSRYTLELIEDELYGETYVPLSDVAAMNSLASSFGLAFVDDYLYNTAENEGNYQYIILRDFRSSPITEGLEKVVFYAAHSLALSEQPLVAADEGTTSSVSEQSGGLTAMALGGNGRVLAVTDFSFMTEPYNAAADNNRLISNIARFLTGGARTFGLSEFPHFFGPDVDLVWMQPGDDRARPAAAVEDLSALQEALREADKELYWRTTQHGAHDVFYLGLYSGLEDWPEVQGLLSAQGISLTLETVEEAPVAPAPTATVTVEAEPEASPTPTPAPRDWIHLPSLGWVEVRETALFYQNESDGRQVLVVLAFSDAGLSAAAERLLAGDFGGCLLDEDRQADPERAAVALCPTTYQPQRDGPTVDETPTPQPDDAGQVVLPEAAGEVLIVADDDGEGVYEWWTSAYVLYEVVTTAGYEPLIWSTSADGEVTAELLSAYRAVLWCTGDYQAEDGNPSPDEIDLLTSYLADENGAYPQRGLLLMGAFLSLADDGERGLLLDIEVTQADHPLAAGFEAGQTVTLERFTAEEDYAPYVLRDVDAESVIWSQGPESEFAGEAVVAADEVGESGSRFVVMSVPLYLLPYEEGLQLGTNIVSWLIPGG